MRGVAWKGITLRYIEYPPAWLWQPLSDLSKEEIEMGLDYFQRCIAKLNVETKRREKK